MAYDDKPERNNQGQFHRGLQEAEKSLQELREQHEKEANDLKMRNLQYQTLMTKKQIKELGSLEMDVAKKVNEFQASLKEKYSQKYTQKQLQDVAIQKRLIREVEEYAAMEKRRHAVQEQRDLLAKHKEKISLIQEEQEVALQSIEAQRKAAKRALQSDTKNKNAARKKYRAEMKRLNAEEAKERKKTTDKLRSEGATELDIMEATKTLSAEGVKEAIFSKQTTSNIANNLINGFKQMFESTIQTYGTYQAKVNTRLQGSGSSWQGNGILGYLTGGMYSGGIESKLKLALGSNPYVKLQEVMDNVVKATEAGIANNVEQRAFLATISENIAATFDAFDSNLMRVIRLQQADTTAARLGLEAGLTSFFNENFKDNSYLNSVFDTVSQNLLETTSQLTAQEGVALEYTIQKWLGSLYSVGFSETAVGKISQALGYLGSGNISALTSDTDMQNLIVMAASRANMSYSDLLVKGLDSSNTNKLLRSMVDYLAEIAGSDNKVVKSEYARIFGMNVSDLKAVTNLSSDLDTISKSAMSYSGAISELYDQMGQLTSRISQAGLLQNMLSNVQYSLGTSIASNPMTYALWQITSMIEDLTGGIALPTVSVMGNSVDLNTTVTNLMRTGIVGASTLGAIGSIVSGIDSTLAPTSMLSKLGITGGDPSLNYRQRGSRDLRRRQLRQQSQSTTVGNTAGADYYAASLTAANETVDTTIQQKKQEATDVTLNNIHEYLLSVFDPKVTEIERLIALLAGYQTTVSNWGNFQNGEKKFYQGTTVQISNIDFENDKKDNLSILTSINSNTANILTLLKTVFGDDGSRPVNVQAANNFSTGGTGLV